VCVCVYVCVGACLRKRERERQADRQTEKHLSIVLPVRVLNNKELIEVELLVQIFVARKCDRIGYSDSLREMLSVVKFHRHEVRLIFIIRFVHCSAIQTGSRAVGKCDRKSPLATKAFCPGPVNTQGRNDTPLLYYPVVCDL